jgi:hypothetical protein
VRRRTWHRSCGSDCWLREEVDGEDLHGVLGATVLAGTEGFSRVMSLSNSSPRRRLGEGKVLEGNSGGCARPGGGGTRVLLKEEIKKGVGLQSGRG